MTQQELKAISCELSALTVFRNILKNKSIKALLNFLSSDGDTREKMELYGEFVFSLSDDDYCFSRLLSRTVYEDENRYIISAAAGREQTIEVLQNAEAELSLFSRLTELSADSLCEGLEYGGYIPRFSNHPVDFKTEYAKRLKNIGRYGYGIFASAGMFRVENGEIVPVEAADKISLDSFIGYESERQKVLENTRALVEGRPAANALLFGDAGTGKSSTVKACANSFFDEGLRLIEVRKDQLFSLSHIMGRIANNPLKFIIFIDDLSFNKNDDCFSMLKAALEGSAAAKAENAVIYATSNRRHIVKENFSDRAQNDDIHHNDTVQELMSLSDRFGLTVYFGKPDKSLYLEIIHTLAQKHGITRDKASLDTEAEAFALSRGSRSPRAAEQFINSLIG